MQIRPTNLVARLANVDLKSTSAQTAQPAVSILADRAEFSAAAQQIQSLGQEIRADRVAAIRAQIASGVYDSPAKISQAIDRLLDEIG
jgi:negative regulator of flagellin synthesis FlgM